MDTKMYVTFIVYKHNIWQCQKNGHTDYCTVYSIPTLMWNYEVNCVFYQTNNILVRDVKEQSQRTQLSVTTE
jgi:hypothetical protein